MKKARFKNGLQGKGFAAALVLSIAAVGVSTYAAYTSSMEKLTAGETVQTDDNVFIFDDAKEAGANRTDVPKTVTTTAAPPETAASEPEAQDAGIFFSTPKTMPAEGEILNSFSNGELVKSETLGVWKTHDGADIAAEQGAAVASCMKGKVTEIRKDPLWGVCVVIDHGDGIEGHYCGLAETLNVKAGQEVTMGEIIGQVGNTAEVECKTDSHLHFGIKKNGAWIDPVEFLK